MDNGQTSLSQDYYDTVMTGGIEKEKDGTLNCLLEIMFQIFKKKHLEKRQDVLNNSLPECLWTCANSQQQGQGGEGVKMVFQ